MEYPTIFMLMLYAQLSFKPSYENENKIMERVINCIDDVKTWMITNLLQLNTDKTEFIIFGTQQQLSKINRNLIVVAETNVEITTSARNLGIRFDNVLSMNEQIHFCRIYPLYDFQVSDTNPNLKQIR